MARFSSTPPGAASLSRFYTIIATQPSDLKRLRDLEEENRKLKHMYATLSLDHQILKEVVEKKL